jgi:integrase
MLQPLGLTIEPGDCVFPMDPVTARGLPKDPQALRRPFRRACKKVGIPNSVVPHSGRHTVGTTAAPGIGIVDTAALLGDTPATVAKLYGHAVEANIARGVAIMDAMLGPRPEQPANVVELPRKSA